MAQRKIVIEIPEDIVNTLKIGYTQLTSDMRYEIAKKYFLQHSLSLGKAAQLAAISRMKFMEQLSKENIVLFDYDEEDFAAELEGVKKLDENNL